jgi:hypothetical protein
MELTESLRQRLLTAQTNEITEHHVYRQIAARLKDSTQPAGIGRNCGR